MKIGLCLCLIVLCCLHWTSPTHVGLFRRKRAASPSLADVLGMKTSGNTRKKKPVKITPPMRLKPGETAVRAPGWQHCIKNIKAGLSWRSIKSPGYPDFLESQIQCSWIMEAPIGMKVKLAFRDLDMVGTTGSCAKQFVQIIDIGTGKSQGRFCGSSRPGDYVTLGTKARIDLQADKAVTKARGFFLSFAAVNEISGFRSTKLFQQMSKSSAAAPGRVNVKNFASNTKQATPKPSTNKRRGNKRLVYESDLKPRSTDPSATNTDSGASNSLESDDDLGWIGENDQPVTSRPGSTNRRRNSPAKVIPTSQKRAPPGGRSPTTRQRNAPAGLNPNTSPVRIRAPPAAIRKTPKPNTGGGETVIYGKENQPHDPNHYTTLHPVRLKPRGFIDHREQKLSTTNVIVIVASTVLFVIIIIGIVAFLWLLRKRRNKRRKRKQYFDKKKKEEQDEKRETMELNVARLFSKNPANSSSHGYPPQRSDHPNFLPGQLSPREIRQDHPGRYINDRTVSRTRSDRRNVVPNGRSNAGERETRFESRNGLSFGRRKKSSRRRDANDQFQSIGTKDGISTISMRENDLRRSGSNPKSMKSKYMHKGLYKGSSKYVPHENHGFIPFHARGMARSREDHTHSPGRSSSPNSDFNSNHHQTTSRLPQEEIKHSIRFHSLDPQYLSDDNTTINARENEAIRVNHRNITSYPESSAIAYPRWNNEVIPNNAGEEIDEDYCSGSESGYSKAPMRRQYSQWELEQQKKERKKKLIG